MELLVGTYTLPVSGMEGGGEGISAVSFDPETGGFGAPRPLARCVNPSCLALTPDQMWLFAGREVFAGEDPGVTVFRVGEDLVLTEQSHLPLSGELPCHLAYDTDNNRLASSQYGTGDLAVSQVVDGCLQPPVYLTRTGSGPNVGRQEGPHAHFSAFSDAGSVLHLVDLGTDSVTSHRLDGNGQTVEIATLNVSAGAGPRHMALNRDGTRAHVFCELDESLITLTRKALGWRISGVQPGFAAPDGEDGAGAAIRLSPDERHIYISGRRQSRIACFAAKNEPEPICEVDCGGVTPREFIVTPDGNWVISANQSSGTLTSLRRDPVSGIPTLTPQSCKIKSPVALIAVP